MRVGDHREMEMGLMEPERGGGGLAASDGGEAQHDELKSRVQRDDWQCHRPMLICFIGLRVKGNEMVSIQYTA